VRFDLDRRMGAAERREVEPHLSREPAFASEVMFWEQRLGGLAEAGCPGIAGGDTVVHRRCLLMQCCVVRSNCTTKLYWNFEDEE
jgi:hypothetical protein